MRLFKSCEDGVHSFEARYNNYFPKALIDRLLNVRGDMEHMKEQSYIHDICIKCGLTIKPTTAKEPS